MKRFFLASIFAMHASAQSQTQIAQPEVSRDCPKDIVTTAKPLLRYPTLLATQQIEGKTLVRILIDENHKAKQVKVEQSSGYTEFDQEALRMVCQMEFDASLAGWVQQPITFKLSNAAPLQRPFIPEEIPFNIGLPKGFRYVSPERAHSGEFLGNLTIVDDTLQLMISFYYAKVPGGVTDSYAERAARKSLESSKAAGAKYGYKLTKSMQAAKLGQLRGYTQELANAGDNARMPTRSTDYELFTAQYRVSINWTAPKSQFAKAKARFAEVLAHLDEKPLDLN
jgi:TonB family protein